MLQWLASWTAAVIAAVGGAFLAQGLTVPTLPEVLIGIATVASIGFLLATVRAHARPGALYPATFLLIFVIGLLTAAGVIPVVDEPRQRGLTLLGASLLLLILARPSRVPGKNLTIVGPTRAISWKGEPASVPAIRVVLGYVTVDATQLDWSQVAELQVTLFASRLELVVPTSEDIKVIVSGVSLFEQTPRPASELATTISVVGALGAIEVHYGTAPHQGIPADDDSADGANSAE